MKYPIAFIDTEIEPKSRQILDIGGVRSDGCEFHKKSFSEFVSFLSGTQFVCGHNILNHDIKYIGSALQDAGINPADVIDTLPLSPLLFPTKPYHALLKDDKLQTDEVNNPLNDSIKARYLFHDEIAAFQRKDDLLKEIFFGLLGDTPEFQAFFRFISYTSEKTDLEDLIRQKFEAEICIHADLAGMIAKHPIELAYCLSLIDSLVRHRKTHSITPPWVLKNYPHVERIMFRLRNTPCVEGCPYCNSALDIHKGLKHWFGFDSFRCYAGEPLQENAVRAAVDNKSLLAVFPTGGGKSITFQLPALMSGENAKGLTIVISPLQSLMKDQVDNLEKAEITDAVTINGLLDPIERAKSFERVEDGSASILYISPESLRSRTIERLILGRNVVRFVIDEAHCFSAWGQDFRVDYLYIGDFIRSIQEKKNMAEPIPVSCFTATAKQKVIEDIRSYFREKLSLEFEVFASKASRTNLHFKVLAQTDAVQKYQTLRRLLEAKSCPTIIYASRTHRATELARCLTRDGFPARAYHGRMDTREKTANQNAFIAGEFQIMVATSAFGMGVDKKDVGMVIHYDISDSLENYIQEAGRAGRNERIEAECYVLFNEDDLNKHFVLLNQTKLSFKEIQQIWKAIKELARFRSTVSNSALEIARKAGWDDSVPEIETRVTTAISALEDAGYLKRGQNMPRVFANSIRSKTAQEAIEKIRTSARFDGKRQEYAVRIIKKLFSSRSRKQSDDEVAESRIDYISDHLGIKKEEVISVVNLMREEGILADAKDLTAFIKRSEFRNRSLLIVSAACWIESFLLDMFDNPEKVFYLKEINEKAVAATHDAALKEINITLNKIKVILNFWAIKNWIKRKSPAFSKDQVLITWMQPKETFREKMKLRHELAKFIVGFLYNRSTENTGTDKEEAFVEFSVLELKDAFERSIEAFGRKISLEEVEDSLFYLSRIEALKIEGGFLVVYNRLTIERLEKDNKKRYKLEDYQRLLRFYENKIQQIHIVGEYAQKMITGSEDALKFVDDYFALNYASFLNLYFKGSRQSEIKRNITPAKYRQLFGELSPAQLQIIRDQESKYIVVAAGPGSGKTRVLVHKLASLMLMEDVKHEQLLMLTFSRAAATEFKKRLLKLIGNAANFIEIKTFHSYCFDLLGQIGSLERVDNVLKCAVERIEKGDVELSRITKNVLVIDEAQDMNEDEFSLIEALIRHNDDMRIIAVGNDDQSIYEFRHASPQYFKRLIREYGAMKYELVENFRSKSNLVDFTNQFVARIHHRLKENPIIAKQTDNGKIKVVHYKSENLIEPLVKDILSAELRGSVCVLTYTNDEALQVSGLLLKNGMPAKLIQDNSGFCLLKLDEINFFLSRLHSVEDIFLIDDDVWNQAKKELQTVFQNSSKLESCLGLIRDFETINPKRRYKSDLELFIRESKLNDFFGESGETIFVSTIHKVKGKEFDHVFLMLNNFNLSSDERIRQLYVAMTRARRELTIHLNSDFLDGLSSEAVEHIEDKNDYLPPEELAIHLTHSDIWLDYFINRQPQIAQLRSGDTLYVRGDECLDGNGQSVLKFSRNFMSEHYERLHRQGYELKRAMVNFIVCWQSEKVAKEIKIILPELFFERKKISE